MGRARTPAARPRRACPRPTRRRPDPWRGRHTVTAAAHAGRLRARRTGTFAWASGCAGTHEYGPAFAAQASELMRAILLIPESRAHAVALLGLQVGQRALFAAVDAGATRIELDRWHDAAVEGWRQDERVRAEIAP